MLNNENKNIALAIAAVHCPGDAICATSVFNRLNSIFDNNTFNNFISTLRSRAYLTGGFQNLGALPGGFVKIKFIYTDVVNGSSGSGIKIVPGALFEQNNFDAILKLFDRNLFFVKQLSDNSTLFYNASQGYNIAYVVNPTGGGSGGSGGSGGGDGETPGGGSGGGEIVINPGNGGGGSYLNPPASVPVQNVFSGFDYQSLLIPGVIILGLYFFMNRK